MLKIQVREASKTLLPKAEQLLVSSVLLQQIKAQINRDFNRLVIQVKQSTARFIPPTHTLTETGKEIGDTHSQVFKCVPSFFFSFSCSTSLTLDLSLLEYYPDSNHLCYSSVVDTFQPNLPRKALVKVCHY